MIGAFLAAILATSLLLAIGPKAEAAEELVPKLGLGVSVSAVAFSPDGRLMVIGNRNNVYREVNTASLWDMTTGRELRRFEGHWGHGNAVTSVTISPDGRFVLTGSGDRTARLWNASTGRELRRFEGHKGYVASAAFSSDGRLVLTGSNDGTARLWDASSGRELRRFERLIAVVTSAALSPDGPLVLTRIDDQTARLSDASSGRELRRFEGNIGKVTSATFSPDGQFVLTKSGYTARLWDASANRELRRFEGHDGYVTSAIFSPDGRLVLTGSNDNTARLWDASSGRELRRFEGHDEDVASVAFSPDGRLVLTGSDDKTARLWDVATGRERLRLITYSDGEWIAIGDDGRFEGSEGVERHLVVMDNNTGRDTGPVWHEFGPTDRALWRRGVTTAAAGPTVPSAASERPPEPLALERPPAPQPLPPVAVSPTFTGPRQALVVGIDAYRAVQPLTRAVADARALAATLRSPMFGFTVTEVLNPDRYALNKAVAAFAAGIQRGALALVLFSGHGVEIPGSNLLLPADFPDITTMPTDVGERLAKTEAMELNRMVGDIAAAKPRYLLALIDACRDNPLARPGGKTIGGARGFTRLPDPVAETTIVFSAGLGEKALDRLPGADANPNSLFMRHFLREIAAPGVTFDAAVRATARAVVEDARRVNHSQRPAIQAQIYDDIVLTAR